MIALQRGDWVVDVDASSWAEMLLFLSKCGWRPSVPTHSLLASNFHVSDDAAKGLAAAGEIVLEETLKDPLSACSVLQFDVGKLAEIVTFAAEGGFVISRQA